VIQVYVWAHFMTNSPKVFRFSQLGLSFLSRVLFAKTLKQYNLFEIFA
jgi:hypothetical protein